MLIEKFCRHDRKCYIQFIDELVIDSMKTLCQHSDEFQPIEEVNEPMKKIVEDHKVEPTESDEHRVHFKHDLSLAIQRLWRDPGIQATFLYAGNGLHLRYSAGYFLDRLPLVGPS